LNDAVHIHVGGGAECWFQIQMHKGWCFNIEIVYYESYYCLLWIIIKRHLFLLILFWCLI